MMKLRQSLKNLARCGLLFNLLLIILFVFGCTSSTAPTYIKKDIGETIQNICKKEYKIDVKVKLAGQTLWIYLPLEDIFVKSDKPDKYVERFLIEYNNEEFKNDTLEVEYLIKTVPEQEKYQELKYGKGAIDKINSVWKVLRRVLFSMERLKKSEPQFFCLVTADIKNGFQIKELFYLEDLKKVSYQFISWSEYQHRTIQDMQIEPKIIGDKEGLYLDYKDITWNEFIADQIKHRIKLKFQKPEVERNVDIDKEIMKVVIYTLKAYGFKDFYSVELNNLLTQNKIILNQAAVWARPVE